MAAGPIAWASQLSLSYVLASASCFFTFGGLGVDPLLHLVTLAMVFITLAAGVVAYRGWRKTGGGADAGGAVGRSAFMALAGMTLSGFFGIGILLLGMSGLFFHGC
jgi:hypothetical protein